MHGVEPESLTRVFAIERQIRCSIACSRAERTLTQPALHGTQPFGVIAQFGCESAGPQRHRARHRLLHVRVAGDLERAFARSQIVQRLDDRPGALGQLVGDIAQIQPQRRQHLIVARATEMYALARFTDPCGQKRFQRRLTIFLFELHLPLTTRVLCGNLGEPATNRFEIFGAQETTRMQHFRMHDRRARVIRDQSIVERVIFSRRVAQHSLIERCALIPKAGHGETPYPEAPDSRR